RRNSQTIERNLVRIRVAGPVLRHHPHADALRDAARRFLHQRLFHLKAFTGGEFEVQIGVIRSLREGVAEYVFELGLGEAVPVEEETAWFGTHGHRLTGTVADRSGGTTAAVSRVRLAMDKLRARCDNHRLESPHGSIGKQSGDAAGAVAGSFAAGSDRHLA